MAFVYEGASGLVTGVLRDTATETGIQPQSLSVYIYDRDSETELLPLTALTPVATYVDASGNLVYYISPSANIIIATGKEREIHVLRLTWTWTAQSATQTGKEELHFEVINLTPN